jgi:two-component system, chemotaxis family, protein-glutamate methylesterase/glutaminase
MADKPSTAGRATGPRGRGADEVAMQDAIPRFTSRRFGVVAIGSSTGGPPVLDHIVGGLPADLSVPIVIAQHMPPVFTQSFAASLDRQSPLTVVHAEEGMALLPGVVYIGRGKQHFRVVRRSGRMWAQISDEPRALVFKPSADELLRSCAAAYGDRVLAVVLTGIGRDGTEGARAVRGAGGMVLAQDRASCAVYGMPKSCHEAGLADAMLDPERIRRTIGQLSPTFTAADGQAVA